MNFNKTIHIGAFRISEDSPVFIIAEAGVNHDGNLEKAKKLIDCSVEAKVDAVKFQSFKTENVILKNVPKAPYQQETTGCSETQFEMIKKLEFSRVQDVELNNYCHQRGIMFLTTPGDEHTLDELDPLDLQAYKIASMDLVNLAFLKKVAKKGKPIILSTGMSDLDEIETALKEIHPLNKDVILMHCTTNYPIKDNEAHLKVIIGLKERFNILTGFSDHSGGTGAGPYAVAVGAKVVEKHFTLDKRHPGPDHLASLSPEELRSFVQQIRKVEEYLGDKEKKLQACEMANIKVMRKSLVAACKIAKGEKFSETNVIAKRAGGLGMSSKMYPLLIGTISHRNYKVDDVIQEAL